jgi:hypothetical protein
MVPFSMTACHNFSERYSVQAILSIHPYALPRLVGIHILALLLGIIGELVAFQQCGHIRVEPQLPFLEHLQIA